MKIAVLQHADYEGPGEIARWAEERGHHVGYHLLHSGDRLPELDEFDLLVVMGGEMNIYQHRDWPWLRPESALIKSALEQGKRIVGVCLGAQLIADALGARVKQNEEIELGWLPVTWTDEARALFPSLSSQETVLHWHGDTFSLPAGAMRLAASEACAEQGFLIPQKCLAVQFHLETDVTLVRRFVESQGKWPTGRCVQSPEAIMNEAGSFCERNKRLLYILLDRFCG